MVPGMLLVLSGANTVVIVLIVAFVLVATGVMVFRGKRGGGGSRTTTELGGFGVKAKLTDEQSAPALGKVHGENLKSHEGSIEATNRDGGDVTVKGAESRGDIRLTTGDGPAIDPRNPKARP